jgi:SRSO17 transposase
MSVLEHPTAQALLEQATLSPQQIAALAGHLDDFLRRYGPCFYRQEHRDNAALVLQGKLSGLERKTSEPIAIQAGVHRKPIQAFVGGGKWDDETVNAELRRHVAQEWADPQAVLTLDGSGFAKKGDHSCGVQRQWCGRLGKVENCQVGLFLGYACRWGHVLVDRRLFLPKEWVKDAARRKETHVPKGTRYREHWQIALDLLRRSSKGLPHAWVTADSELGRSSVLRARLRRLSERYLVEVPADTNVRDLDVPVTGRRKAPFLRVDRWAQAQPAERWRRFHVRDGEKGPVAVEVLTARVQARHRGRVGPEERLAVLREPGGRGDIWYKLSNAPASLAVQELVRAHGEHHRVEQLLEEGKGEVGLGQYEVRSWVGWHHHMTLSLLALWFLAFERQRQGGKKSGADGVAGAAGVHAAAAAAAAERAADRRGGQPRAAA